jgi:hypothetical protein
VTSIYYTHVDKEGTASNKNEMSLLFYNYGSRKVLSRNVARFAKGFLQRNRVFQSPPLDQDSTTSRGKLPHKYKKLQANLGGVKMGDKVIRYLKLGICESFATSCKSKSKNILFINNALC